VPITSRAYVHLKIWIHEIFFLPDILFTSCYFTCTCLVLEISLFGSIVVKRCSNSWMRAVITYDNVTLSPHLLQRGLRFGPIQRNGAAPGVDTIT
jgi:hypothetical protein